jgi:hypothetical protein
MRQEQPCLWAYLLHERVHCRRSGFELRQIRNLVLVASGCSNGGSDGRSWCSNGGGSGGSDDRSRGFTLVGRVGACSSAWLCKHASVSMSSASEVGRLPCAAASAKAQYVHTCCGHAAALPQQAHVVYLESAPSRHAIKACCDVSSSSVVISSTAAGTAAVAAEGAAVAAEGAAVAAEEAGAAEGAETAGTLGWLGAVGSPTRRFLETFYITSNHMGCILYLILDNVKRQIAQLLVHIGDDHRTHLRTTITLFARVLGARPVACGDIAWRAPRALRPRMLCHCIT